MNQNQEQTLAARLFGAAVDRIKEAPREIMQEGIHQVGAGAHEMAAALFNGSGFVMYQRGTKDDPAKDRNGQEQGQQHEQQHERQIERDGMSR